MQSAQNCLQHLAITVIRYEQRPPVRVEYGAVFLKRVPDALGVAPLLRLDPQKLSHDECDALGR